MQQEDPLIGDGIFGTIVSLYYKESSVDTSKRGHDYNYQKTILTNSISSRFLK
jgi:hypothetical protein